MVEPNVSSPEEGDAIPVAPRPVAVMGKGIPDHATTAGLDVMYVEAVDDDIVDILDCDPGPVVDVHLVAAAVDGLVAAHDQLLIEPDHHAPGKYDPQRLILDDGMAKGPLSRRHKVVVGGVVHDVESPRLPAGGVPPEAQPTVGESLAVALPVLPASPTSVDGVGCMACTSVNSQVPPFIFLTQGPASKRRLSNESGVG